MKKAYGFMLGALLLGVAVTVGCADGGGIVIGVGTILVTINQGDILLSGDVAQRHLLKIGMTYTVPYLVSTLSSVGAIRNSVRNG